MKNRLNRPKCPFRICSGFTMVEVLITTAIIAIVTSISLISISALREQRAVEGGARQVAAAIREAQNYALTGRNIRAADDVPCQFRFRTEAPDRLYVEQSNAGPSCGDASNWRGYLMVVGDGITISESQVRFEVPRAEPFTSSGSELQGGLSVDFVVSRGDTERHVCVYPLGRVEEQREACSTP